jgi:excinuclease ABC subunit C
MIDDVVAFLEGRTVDVRARLRERMDAAAAALQFERAAQVRDALRWLEQLEQPASVEFIGGGDADAIGFARDGEDAVGAILRVRDGKVIARDHRFFEIAPDTVDEDILAAFLVRYYVPAEARARRVILPFTPSDFDAIQDLLPDAQWGIPTRGARYRLVALADQNARHLLESFKLESFETEERVDDPVYALGRDLGLTVMPRNLVCIDISTNQGRDTVGSLVWFENGRPKKSEYRKFKVGEPRDAGQGQGGPEAREGVPDDYAGISEVVTRYTRRRIEESKPLPDLMVIDGGKGQLGAAAEALRQLDVTQVALAALAKREEEIFLPGRASPLKLPARAPSLRLLQRARDEAHRFALTYSRQRRKARTVTSELLSVPGIGDKRRRLLIERFGSLAGVRLATPEEIASIPGFSQKLALRVLDHLRS